MFEMCMFVPAVERAAEGALQHAPLLLDVPSHGQEVFDHQTSC